MLRSIPGPGGVGDRRGGTHHQPASQGAGEAEEAARGSFPRACLLACSPSRPLRLAGWLAGQHGSRDALPARHRPRPPPPQHPLAQQVNWPQFYAVVHWIQAVTAALSVIGSSSVIGYAVFQNGARTPEVLNRLGRRAVIFSSAIPLTLMIPAFGVGNHYECYQNITRKHGCLLMRTDFSGPKQPPCASMSYYSITVFLVSFLATFLSILVSQVGALKAAWPFVISTGYMGDCQRAMIKMVEQGVVLYPVVFLCCWGPAFILGIIELVQVQNDTVYMVFCVLEALTASSQGLLNCAVYGWTQHMSRCLKREACRDVDTQTPLLRSQKRFYASTFQTHPPSGPQTASAAL
ncbi:hypothetical protein JRQ81_007897 [Phrynocephalus forsythii]|uniref:Transmembrane protein 116 n=1 Tax=Phrynocephalus forsythii TaxID=171643 RepID=A0A9Q0XEF7_9SAUR|nr:hypothetical protein JRQ81_007897 [Phrynocephalus forsythii]